MIYISQRSNNRNHLNGGYNNALLLLPTYTINNRYDIKNMINNEQKRK